MDKTAIFKHFSLHIFVASLLFSLFFNSCIPQKKVKYLQNKGIENPSNEFTAYKTEEYKIKPHDYLYIKVLSLDEKTYQFFNTESTSDQNISNIDLYLTSYEVSDSGYIDFPFVGKIKTVNLTIIEAKELIQSSINQYLKQTTIIVKLVNFNITILGEVIRPGRYQISNSKINLFEAIGLAGDLTDYGNRNTINFIRKTAQGSKLIEIDLTDKSILNSEYYYLQPNDIIYVEPLHAKVFGIRSVPFGTILSSITTLLLVLNFLK